MQSFSRKATTAAATLAIVFALLLAAACSRPSPTKPQSEVKPSPRSTPEATQQAASSQPASNPLPAAEQQTNQGLAPLTDGDVKLYLSVMQSAADRVQHPTDSDKKTLEIAKQAAAAGHTPSGPEVAAMIQATKMKIAMDQAVAEEQHIDIKRYESIRSAIETVIINPAFQVSGSGDSSQAVNQAQTVFEQQLQGVNAVNAKLLQPYKADIQKVLRVVRNPANMQ